MFPSKCPKCGKSLIGVSFTEKGPATWQDISAALVRSGMAHGSTPKPPGMRKGYIATVQCPGCGATVGDFPVMLKDGYLQWHTTVRLYESSDVLTPEMLKEAGSRTEIGFQRPELWQAGPTDVAPDGIEYFAPIAEWRGVAVCEKPGGQRAVWEGVEYGTDGKCYLLRQISPDMFDAVPFASERATKEFIGAMTENECRQYLSCRSALVMLGAPDKVVRGFNRLVPSTWDEKAGVFRWGDPNVFHDGAHRISPQ